MKPQLRFGSQIRLDQRRGRDSNPRRTEVARNGFSRPSASQREPAWISGLRRGGAAVCPLERHLSVSGS